MSDSPEKPIYGGPAEVPQPAKVTVPRFRAAKGKRMRSTLLVLDDCSWDAKSFRTPAPILAQLYRNGRHNRITVIMTCQDVLDIGVGLRGQVDADALGAAAPSPRDGRGTGRSCRRSPLFSFESCLVLWTCTECHQSWRFLSPDRLRRILNQPRAGLIKGTGSVFPSRGTGP